MLFDIDDTVGSKLYAKCCLTAIMVFLCLQLSYTDTIKGLAKKLMASIVNYSRYSINNTF
ncbi:hypothetical protein CEP87_02805 [Psychrobacter cryohalolentis]|nr:hypothetical protein CEP87_02805 [Psychrobacter cryohalolentis]